MFFINPPTLNSKKLFL
ncbi:hypothetical protein HF086_011544 [Spodoptera exigua]|uniref:Uncharacterized protein n=1 Tax=Spodoptera exigua TaxID=7107 RepID=A0A922MD70_SPOEX|nr:hypothetical protein HF086_011544 [Spodoptera exigua]